MIPNDPNLYWWRIYKCSLSFHYLELFSKWKLFYTNFFDFAIERTNYAKSLLESLLDKQIKVIIKSKFSYWIWQLFRNLFLHVIFHKLHKFHKMFMLAKKKLVWFSRTTFLTSFAITFGLRSLVIFYRYYEQVANIIFLSTRKISLNFI